MARSVLLACIATMCLMILAVASPRAQMRCFEATATEQRLRDQYGETPFWVGQSPRGPIVLTQSADGATWSIYLRMPDRVCPLVDGKGGQSVDSPPAVPGKES